MSQSRWLAEIRMQSEFLELEEEVLLNLLSETGRVETGGGIPRDLRQERVLLREHFTSLSDERNRLDLERTHVANRLQDRDESIFDRRHRLALQTGRVERLLADWRSGEARGRRRRRRDQLFGDALHLEHVRLLAEARRIREQHRI